MSKIKFRAFDEDNKTMLYNVVPLSNTEIIEIHPLTQLARIKQVKEVMQFTGLHDTTKLEQLTHAERNRWFGSGNKPEDWKGKEIYKGDIVQSSNMFPSVVWFGDGCFSFNGDDPFLTHFAIYPDDDIKIIGNIHEHPNLLSEAQ